MSTPHTTIHAIMQAATHIIEASGRVIDPAESSTMKNRLIPYIARHEAPDLAVLVEYVSSGMLSSDEAQELIVDAMPAPPKEAPLWTEAEDRALAAQDSSTVADGVLLRQPAAVRVSSATEAHMLRLSRPPIYVEPANIDGKPAEMDCPSLPQMLTTALLLPEVEPVRSTSGAVCDTACRALDREPTGSTWGEEASKTEGLPPLEGEVGLGDLPLEGEDALEVEQEAGLVELQVEAEDGVGESPNYLKPVPQIALDETHLRQSKKNAPPSRADLMYAEFQIWHNVDPERTRQSEWTLKIRSEGDSISGVAVHFVGFKASPRRAREAVQRHAQDGKVSAAWAAEFCRETADMNTAAQVGIASTREYIVAKRPKGQSSNARAVFEGCWAVLILNPQHTAPHKLKVYFPGSPEPVVVDRFHIPNAMKGNKPGWLGFHDPDELHTLKREQEAIDRHRAERKAFTTYSPITKLGQYLATYWDPMVDAHQRMTAEIATLTAQVEAMQTVVRALVEKVTA